MNWNQEVKRRRKPSYVYRYTYVQNRHNIFLKIRAAKLKKWCVYVCGKRGGGGGGRTAYRVGNPIYI